MQNRIIKRYGKKKSKKQKQLDEINLLLNGFDKKQLIHLLNDLYNLSTDNQIFFHTRFLIGDELLATYKQILKKALNPDLQYGESLDMIKAGNAIKQFVMATDFPMAEADLKIYYVECGNSFTLNYGDIDEEFYEALAEMYEEAVETVLELPPEDQYEFIVRLYDIITSVSDIGWGYPDELHDIFYNAFTDDDLVANQNYLKQLATLEL